MWSWGNSFLCIDRVLIFFCILVLREYWALAESRIPVLAARAVRIVALSISFREQTKRANQ